LEDADGVAAVAEEADDALAIDEDEADEDEVLSADVELDVVVEEPAEGLAEMAAVLVVLAVLLEACADAPR
jgi:hypothetical protein